MIRSQISPLPSSVIPDVKVPHLCHTAPSLLYRKGVRLGNYVEDLGNETYEPVRSDSSFATKTTSKEAFCDAGKTGTDLLAISQRGDVLLKYGKYGTTHNPYFGSGNKEGGFFATTFQLLFGAEASSQPLPGSCHRPLPRTVQQCLWTGSKSVDSKVPRTIGVQQAAEAREERLRKEAARSMYLTVEKVGVLK